MARPLTWHEYAWMGLPALLVFTGGALGALIGLAAIFSSSRIFRGDRPGAAKYFLSGLISAAAVVVFLVAAVAIDVLTMR